MKKLAIVFSVIVMLIVGFILTESPIISLGILVVLFAVGKAIKFFAGLVVGFSIFISDLLKEEFGLIYLLIAIFLVLIGFIILRRLTEILF